MTEGKGWQIDLNEDISGSQEVQSVISKVPKVQNDTLECTLEEMAILKLIIENPAVTQKDLMAETGKSLSTVKRVMASLQEKGYIRRVNGKRYDGKS